MLAALLAAVALGGCSEVKGSSLSGLLNCTEHESKSECEATEARIKHEEQVKKEAGEVESVLKKREAERGANAVEEAASEH